MKLDKIFKYFFIIAMSVFSVVAYAQSVNGLIVDKITFKFEGPQQVSKDAVLAHIKIRSGKTFEQNALDLSIKSLYDTNLYDLVEAKKTVNVNGKLDVEFIIMAKYKVGQVVFRGNKEYSTYRLKDEIETYAGTVLDERKIKRDTDKLYKYYQKKGYSFAKITYDIERNHEQGVGVVIFNINEGGDVKIGNINFVGNNHIEASELRSQMKTDTWWWLISYIMDYGRFKEEDFHSDIESLKNYYKNNGYLDVEIDESKVKFEFPDADGDDLGDMTIVIEINEGRQYKTGKIEIRNNKLFPENELLKAFHFFLKSGDVFSPEKVDKGVEDLKLLYGEYGYLDTIVRALRRPNLETGDIDLILDIIESEKFYLNTINIQGNTKTKSEVIIRELAFAPGEIFDLRRMKDSEERLKFTRFFEEVNLSPEPTQVPGRRDLRIIVKETRTGNLTFGAGFSTVESFVATAEVSQSNFDFTNYKNYFQGAGQKFRIRGSIGLKSNQVIISFENPWIFNRQIAYGFDIFRTDTGYYSDYYAEVRTGMTHYIRKYLFEAVEGRLGYTLEDVNIYNVSNNAPWVIKNEEGHRSISEVSLSFLRDDRNNAMSPTEGTRFEILNQFAGGPLLGQTNLYRLEGRAGWWFPVSKYWGNISVFKYANQVFSIVGRVGTVMGYGDKDVPFFEKYFLGGAYNMRGFKYRKVGPIDPATKEPLGGDSFAYLSIEYSWQVFEPLRIAIFYDVGFVNSNSWNWDPSDYNDDFGIGFRVMLMGAPMRIDLGMPLTTGKYNSDGLQFNFSFGTVF